MTNPNALENLLGPQGPGFAAALRAGTRFFDRHTASELLPKVGTTIEEIPPFTAIDKRALQDSYGGNETGAPDDLLAGRGLFYVSEQRRLFLDCTAGHYQMLWGYNHPELCALVETATRDGIVWDSHSNTPQAPVKWLAHRLVELVNAPGERDPMDTALLGVCTGSVACGSALKIMLRVHEQRRGPAIKPVLVTLEGNYHGTGIVTQFMRGLWPKLVLNLEVVMLEPNQPEALEAAFRQHGERIAGFWAEPIMMNREAIRVDPDYLHLARRCCDQVGALMCIDEIQTGFWQPKVFACREMNLQPDLVVVGKGMTAGIHPLSSVLFKQRWDVLDQYDAISTNGSASLPSLVALRSLQLVETHANHIREVGDHVMAGLHQLAAEFPSLIISVQGEGHLAGLKFRQAETAMAVYKKLLLAGVWARVHANHPGHSTVLIKLGLLADHAVVNFVVNQFRAALRGA